MHNLKSRWWRGSLRFKLILSVLLMTGPLVAMLLYNNLYAIDVVRGQVADSYKKMLTLYMNQIDGGLNDIDAYMNSMSGIAGFDLVALESAESDSEYYSSKTYLYNKLNRDITLYGSLSSFFVYQERRQDYMEVYKSQNLTIEERDRIQLYLIDLIESGSIPKDGSMQRWHYARIGNNHYLFDIIQTGGVYLGALVSTDQLLEPLNSLQIGEGGAVLLADDQGETITESKLVSASGIRLHRSEESYYLSGSDRKYLIVESPSVRGSFRLVAAIEDHHILDRLPYLQGLIWFITAGCVLFIPVGLYYMRQAILAPLYRVLVSMKKVRSGDWSIRVNMRKGASDEFRILGDSFNSMMTEIETLRVNVYEEQINKQREELQRLQLQVNPHFFLNSLNIVYNLAKVKNFDLTMELTRSLIHYFRYMFRSNTAFVRMKDELEHTRNYLRIQTLRFPGKLTWSLEVPDYLESMPIPPLVIQSFVENSIKHAVTMDKPVHLSVGMDFLDENSGSRVKIAIQDTGVGFDEIILRELQAGRSVENDKGEHIGIWNVQRRLKLLYGEEMSIEFDNDPSTGGAVVTIVLPVNPETEEAP
ncbi:sensor histidine kinase [Cohnella thailandensis]|uniref:Histidine kinase n=1 Tax=Cohnella thailandensis TaxID=557557 RepID=A0A841SZ18_9BACL|nr:histidine kinase [Cohnella thailandensis]MBB6637154.1 histidine kinase [Cohnella thailandensis]MBP1977028.1 two-component system sensor histidine kinase YesM [Cohnella thailandensis]